MPARNCLPGLMFAMAHDFRIMRSDRASLCVPAVALDINLPASLAALFSAKAASFGVAKNMLLLGERVLGPKALEYGLVPARVTIVLLQHCAVVTGG